MRKTLLVVATVMTGFGFATGQANASALKVYLDADIRSTDPGVNRDGNTDGVVLHMVEGLVGYDARGVPKPLLAESIAVSPDGLTYTFKLRSGVRFHNGETLKADDVVWSWNRYLNPKTGWRCLTDFNGDIGLKVESVTAVDPQTVTIRINEPSPLFLANIARSDCGMTAITHRSSVKPDGSWDKPIGTGPFKLAEWRQREFVSLTRFDGYSNPGGEPNGYVGSKRPLVDEIRFVVISDPATAKAAFIRGDIDILPRLPYSEANELKPNPNITISAEPGLAATTFLLQTRDKLLSNVKLRQAIAAAIDYDELVGSVTYDLAAPNNSLVPVASLFHTDAHQNGFRHDPALAKKLLQEAGYKGQTLKITTNKRNQANFDAAIILQAMLEAVGIKAEVEVLEWGVQTDRWQSGKYQIMSFSYSSRMDPALNYEGAIGPKDSQPRKVWEDKVALDALAEVTSETRNTERQRLFDRLHAAMIDQAPLIPLFSTVTAGASRKSVKGFATNVFGAPLLWEVRKD
ncbi:ABC transporter substrate-binding protein [Bradyrhizobium sp. CCGB01]|uniref:ABC transporter substrate-binding protein n=1 Tax=Bradyrhizobium sp. CCGB01 TaxID=2949634 RepID=UPI0020B36023|nr:ABC transporter substrate-binding protein [Bradyrhizobium sp. CCGB01]MCP3404562.1 ABC transporter substrate-binding protein [Bradyrhizobium sp. CCGB01]